MEGKRGVAAAAGGAAAVGAGAASQRQRLSGRRRTAAAAAAGRRQRQLRSNVYVQIRLVKLANLEFCLFCLVNLRRGLCCVAYHENVGMTSLQRCASGSRAYYIGVESAEGERTGTRGE